MAINEVLLVDYDNSCQNYVTEEWSNADLPHQTDSLTRLVPTIAVIVFKRCSDVDSSAEGSRQEKQNVQHIDRGNVKMCVVLSHSINEAADTQLVRAALSLLDLPRKRAKYSHGSQRGGVGGAIWSPERYERAHSEYCSWRGQKLCGAGRHPEEGGRIQRTSQCGDSIYSKTSARTVREGHVLFVVRFALLRKQQGRKAHAVAMSGKYSHTALVPGTGCGILCFDETELTKHKEQKKMCAQCKTVCCDEQKFSKHMATHFQCEDEGCGCKQWFNYDNELQQHKEEILRKPFPCRYWPTYRLELSLGREHACYRRFESIITLNYHLAGCHGANKTACAV
jgi:hypothetical protein